MNTTNDWEQGVDVVDIAALARGDQMGLAALYDRYAGTMLGIGVGVLRDRREAEDLVHDVFIEVWTRAGEYDPSRGSVRAWIFMRMRSRCLDRVRSAAYRKSESLEARDAAGQGRDTQESRDAWPDELADQAKVRRVVESLPKAQREVVQLGYFKGLSSSDMAQQLSIPMGTVKSRVRAAIQALRSALEVSDDD